jgi:dolichyl-phosphate beta-glucosyltransferase
LSREKRGYGFLRRLGRSFFSRVIRFLVVPNVLDTQCGIKMLRSELAKQVVAKGVINRFAADIELFIIARANHWRYEDFPVELNHRKESSVRLIRDTLIMFKDVLRIKWNFWRDKYVE